MSCYSTIAQPICSCIAKWLEFILCREQVTEREGAWRLPILVAKDYSHSWCFRIISHKIALSVSPHARCQPCHSWSLWCTSLRMIIFVDGPLAYSRKQTLWKWNEVEIQVSVSYNTLKRREYNTHANQLCPFLLTKICNSAFIYAKCLSWSIGSRVPRANVAGSLR